MTKKTKKAEPNTETASKEKQMPNFYVFIDNQEENTPPKGVIFLHKTGKGMNILIGETRYVAFPPKSKS
ncbi:MAG: hypothetical protein JST90_17255 [Bacteroidetes bacterium]|nr:hypothetical protein [Bacteroidota bacterium]